MAAPRCTGCCDTRSTIRPFRPRRCALISSSRLTSCPAQVTALPTVPWCVRRICDRGMSSRPPASLAFYALNPRRTIFDTVAEPLKVQVACPPLKRLDRMSRMLEMVGLTPPSAYLFRYPHAMSGGQQQRVAIARALTIEPIFVLADEPTSMLDVSIRAGVMNLMESHAERLGISYLYITHDLAVARYMCSRIAVMYLDKIVEMGDTEAVIQQAKHPYTQALLSAVPIPDPTATRTPVRISDGVATPFP